MMSGRSFPPDYEAAFTGACLKCVHYEADQRRAERCWSRNWSRLPNG
jgi:hypothetical protein